MSRWLTNDTNCLIVGVMDSPTLAHLVCVAVNAYNAAAAPDTRETEAGSGR